jgi:hypothetical protein
MINIKIEKRIRIKVEIPTAKMSKLQFLGDEREEKRRRKAPN